MSEKRYFKIEYDEEWYLFDSSKISEQLVKEQAEYGYGVFANSLSPSEIVDLLNEQQATIQSLKEENEQLRKDCTILVQSNQEYRKENDYLRNELKEVCNRDCDKCKEEWCDGV